VLLRMSQTAELEKLRRDKYLEYQKNYNKGRDRDSMLFRYKDYYERNKERIAEMKSQRFHCDLCQGRYTLTHKHQHYNSKKHQNALAEQKERIEKMNISDFTEFIEKLRVGYKD
jgi:hypothetical protein